MLQNILYKELEEKRKAFREALKDTGISDDITEILSSDMEKAFLCSDFIFKNCVKNPQLIKKLETSCKDYHKELAERLSEVKTKEELLGKTRLFRTEKMVSIAFKDITYRNDLFATMRELSEMADACIDNVLSILYEWFCKQYGAPADKKGVKQRLIVIAMGKLGARELNFSSDIDIVFAYPEEGNTSASAKI